VRGRTIRLVFCLPASRELGYRLTLRFAKLLPLSAGLWSRAGRSSRYRARYIVPDEDSEQPYPSGYITFAASYETLSRGELRIAFAGKSGMPAFSVPILRLLSAMRAADSSVYAGSTSGAFAPPTHLAGSRLQDQTIDSIEAVQTVLQSLQVLLLERRPCSSRTSSVVGRGFNQMLSASDRGDRKRPVDCGGGRLGVYRSPIPACRIPRMPSTVPRIEHGARPGDSRARLGRECKASESSHCKIATCFCRFVTTGVPPSTRFTPIIWFDAEPVIEHSSGEKK
jgi:hypothetical protein